MDLDKCIKERRSVRNYIDKDIEFEKLAKILDSARYAPSSGNIQNVSLIVIKDKKKRADIATAALKQYWIMDAPVHIVVCNRVENIKRFYGSKGELIYSSQNCSAAIENMLLTAYSLGIGTCWVGAFDEDAVKRVLKIPDSIKVEAIITIGYAKENEELPPKYALENITYFEEWGNTKRS